MKIGDRCFIHGYIDEIRKDTVIIRNKGGYFGTDPGEVIVVNDTAHPNWIPCSERLPEENQWLGGSGRQFSSDVLVSILNNDDEDEWVDVSYTIDGEWALELPRHCEILAWMPLPEPYKEGEQDG